MINSLYSGFNTAVRSMMTSQYALSLHSTNIAHANDPNYTRRELASPSEMAASGPGVLRLRDIFVDGQYRLASGVLGESEIRQDIMTKVEDIFGDPVDGGLRKSIDQFFDAWKGLAENPNDGVARLQVISAGQAFAEEIGSAYSRLSDIEGSINEQLVSQADEVNTDLQKVFELNKHISELQRNNMDTAALEDERDAALDTLAKLTGATSSRREDGTVRVFVGSTPVVDGPTVASLELVDGENGETVPTWNVYNSPTYGGGGSIAGLVSVRDGEISRLKQCVDHLGTTLAEWVNTAHRAGKGLDGTTDVPFFEVRGAAEIVVNPDLDSNGIAAGTSGDPGDGTNALALAEGGETEMLSSVIKEDRLETPRVYYRNLVGLIGSLTRDAQRTKETAETHIRASEQQRQSKCGVSMDEEVANLSIQQKAFTAAARVINVMDQMIDTLINRMGQG